MRRERRIDSARAPNLTLEQVVECAPVVQPGQRVGVWHRVDLT
jgi:hypothetical protein